MDLIKLFAGDWGALKFVAGFVLLPYLYLRDCTEVFKSYQGAIEKIPSQNWSVEDVEKVVAQYEGKLHFFKVEWWLVAAVTILLLGVFLLGEVVRFSSYVGDEADAVQQKVVNATSDKLRNSQDENVASVLDLTQRIEEVELAKGIINGFGFIVALVVVFVVHWRKTDAYRTLQEQTRDQVIESVKSTRQVSAK